MRATIHLLSSLATFEMLRPAVEVVVWSGTFLLGRRVTGVRSVVAPSVDPTSRRPSGFKTRVMETSSSVHGLLLRA